MGFLDWLLGKKKVEENKAENELDLKSIKSSVENRVEQENRSFQPRIEKFFSELKSKNEEFEVSLENLRKANPPERVDEQVLKIAKTSRDSFISKMSAISNVIKRDFSKDIKSFSDYYSTIDSIIDQANKETVKEFMSLDVAFNKETHKAIDRMKEIKKCVDNFRDKLENEEEIIDSFEKTLNGIKQFEEKNSEKSSTQENIEKLKKELEEMKEEKSSLEKSLEDLNQSEIWKSYIKLTRDKENLESEIRKIIEEVVSIFASIDRPLKKFAKFIDEGKLNFKNKDILKRYIESPFDGFVQDTNMETINSTLNSLNETISNKKLIIENEAEILKIIDNLKSSNILHNLSEKYTECNKKLKIMKEQIENHDYLKKKKEAQDKISNTNMKLIENEKTLPHEEKNMTNIENEMKNIEEGLRKISQQM